MSSWFILLFQSDIIRPGRTDSVVTNNDRNTLRQTLQFHFAFPESVSTGHHEIISNI